MGQGREFRTIGTNQACDSDLEVKAAVFLLWSCDVILAGDIAVFIHHIIKHFLTCIGNPLDSSGIIQNWYTGH